MHYSLARFERSEVARQRLWPAPNFWSRLYDSLIVSGKGLAPCCPRAAAEFANSFGVRYPSALCGRLLPPDGDVVEPYRSAAHRRQDGDHAQSSVGGDEAVADGMECAPRPARRDGEFAMGD